MSSKKRKVRSIVSEADHAELERHYRFLLPEDEEEDDDPSNNNTTKAVGGKNSTSSSTWQDRMVRHYHQHLYKDCVLADLTRIATHQQLGLRWRTQTEVASGKGRTSCGNKHCPSHHPSAGRASASDPGGDSKESLQHYQSQAPTTEAEEVTLLESLLPYGALQTDYEVPFLHVERGQTQTELVTLRLCARCAPRLMELSHPSNPALAARQARNVATADVTSSEQPRTRTAGAKEPTPQKGSPSPKAEYTGDVESNQSTSSSSSSSSSLNESERSGSRHRRDHRGRRHDRRSRRKKGKRQSKSD